VQENSWFIAAIWMTLALLAGLISRRTGLSVALAEILMGVVGGNLLHLQTTPWIDWLASLGSVLLTFLAGAEIDPASFRSHLWPSLLIGGCSFFFPFAAALAFARFVTHWTWPAAEIAGIALSTTSVAVVYAVMVETGLNRSEIGKLILAACFVTDLGTVLALGLLFAGFNLWMLVFAVVTAPLLWALPTFIPHFFRWFGGHIAELEIKLLLVVLFLLGGLASSAGSEAVLPAYVIGLALAAVLTDHQALMQLLRSLAFVLLIPFFFIKAGAYISLPALAASALLVISFFGVKVGAKFVGVWPLSRLCKMTARESHYTSLLMSTGLTFGSIASLYGLSHRLINQNQYTILVTVVIASALVPTLIAQTWFRPPQPAIQSLPLCQRPDQESSTRDDGAPWRGVDRSPEVGEGI
jgi:Kef-type K+ transport system membrane component KefB